MKPCNISGISSLIVVLILSAPAQAGGRPDSSSRSWFGNINTGWSFPNGDTGDNLEDSWTLGGGAMYWPNDWKFGIGIDVNYWNADLTSSALQRINDAIDQDPMNDGDVTGGEVETWQLAVSGVLSLGQDTDTGFYLTGGISWNDVTGRVTDTGLVYYPPFCDPWYWWWCYPGGVGPGAFVVGKQSTEEFGWNLGGGYSWRTANGQVFVEARYQQIQVGDENIDYMPLTVGFRW